MPLGELLLLCRSSSGGSSSSKHSQQALFWMRGGRRRAATLLVENISEGRAGIRRRPFVTYTKNISHHHPNSFRRNRPFSSATYHHLQSSSFRAPSLLHTHHYSHQYGCSPENHLRYFASAAPAPQSDLEDEVDNDIDLELELSLEEELEHLLGSSGLFDEEDDQDLRALREQRRHLEQNNLDLELGETSRWDVPNDSIHQGDEEEDTDWDTEISFPEYPEKSPSAELRRQQQSSSVSSSVSSNETKHTPSLSPLDMLEQWDRANSGNVAQLQPIADPLSYVGPKITSSPTDGTQDLKQIQLQLECESQREAVQRYQRLTEQTRSRQDYAALNSLQKLVLNWYQPVRDEIQQRQMDYLLRKKRRRHHHHKSKDKKHHTSKDNKQTETAANRYGPFLAAVESEKLAVIATHEALTLAITKANDKLNHGGATPLVVMAKKLGQAVEQEVLLQRVLKQHMEEERQRTQEEATQMDPGKAAVTEFAKETIDGSSSDGSDRSEIDDDNNVSLDEEEGIQPWSYAESRLKSYLTEITEKNGKGGNAAKSRRNIAYAVRRARRVLNSVDWTLEDHVQVGIILLKILLENATIQLPDGSVEPAFRMERRWQTSSYQFNQKLKAEMNKQGNHGKIPSTSPTRFKFSNVIVVHDALWKLAVADEFESIAATTTRHKPMVIPPEPWTSPRQGGYAWLQTDLIRFHGSQMQREALDLADLSTVLDGLNSLGSQAWKINETVLKVAQECWDQNISLGDIPSRTDHIVPLEPDPPAKTTLVSTDDPDYDQDHAKIQKDRWVAEMKAYKEARNKYRRIKQKNRDLFSLRCSAKLKLGQAEQFQDYDEIFFPYNMDFRGRAYPVPPHLSNVGSDLCRGMLMFTKKKPLGKRGLFWLQVHLANLAGKDKMTFQDRAQYTIDNLENVRAAVDDPFGRNSKLGPDERPWWMGLDDPFQGLATCHEIINAIDSGDPESYMCGLPVHMDGSCNGLQHYAALGRDMVGGTAVNLCNYPEPQDVYIGVMEEVIRRVAEEAERDLDYDESMIDADEKMSKQQRKALARNKSAKLVNGLIDRGVVKRTVMTSVYGVTYIGARQQIQEKIEEKLEDEGHDLDELNYEIFRASGYLAEVTMHVIGDLFTGAKETMNWLTHCARLISAKGHPVAWMTPLGLPAIQPYRQQRSSRIVTAMHSVTVADHSDDMPIHKARSVSAFPPNYIHSLDSTHMLMTALEMDRRGLSFSAVHDSFWTHPCDIDEMNGALRDMFVQLYSQPLLEELKESFELRYPDITFPDLPERGTLDLSEVKESTFFFQ